jgi:hypothetical protein
MVGYVPAKVRIQFVGWGWALKRAPIDKKIWLWAKIGMRSIHMDRSNNKEKANS